VAVLTEVPLNPGFDVSMNIRDIEDHIGRVFEVDWHDLTCYRVFPQGYPDRTAPVILTKKGRISRVELEDSIGHRLAGFPENQELRRQVMELGGADVQFIRRRVFEAVPVPISRRLIIPISAGIAIDSIVHGKRRDENFLNRCPLTILGRVGTIRPIGRPSRTKASG
jgi:hypothetical protein